MSTFVHALGKATIALWGVPARERLRRQLREIGGLQWTEDPTALGSEQTVLLVRLDYLFEARTLKALLDRSNTLLRCPANAGLAAAVVQRGHLSAAMTALNNNGEALPAELSVIEPVDLNPLDPNLRRVESPLLRPLAGNAAAELEDELYGNAYKGITDLVTKWLWPTPAKHMVRFCAHRGISPNAVTAIGFLLMLAAGLAFARGHYAFGLTAGWVMGFLDTVDGKLARVTVRSSVIGHLFDHGMDLVHPPFWYVFWGLSLQGFVPILGLDPIDLSWIVVLGYIGGRLVEGAFQLLGDCSIFTWRPFDAYFRLMTARRNTCLILLTLGIVLGRPDWGFIAVVAWTTGTTLVLLLRFAQGLTARLRGGPLQSWLSDTQAARKVHAKAFRTFSSTRGAYARD